MGKSTQGRCVQLVTSQSASKTDFANHGTLCVEFLREKEIAWNQVSYYQYYQVIEDTPLLASMRKL